MSSAVGSLPCPLFSIRIELPDDQDIEPDLTTLPTKPGVFAMQDAEGGTLALAITANLRRLVKTRLVAREVGDTRLRGIDYRTLARTVLAMTVGSAFEADWAYLQLCRKLLPTTYGSLLDRWRGWFIHCNPDSEFPRFTKTCTPGSAPTGATGVHLGPFADKHAAQKAIDVLISAFDLCRHHNILVEAPDASSCAYKEMSKCPSPCDGSIGMDDYRRRLCEVIEFASAPIDIEVGRIESIMRKAGESLEFEEAQRLRGRLEAIQPLTKPQFRFVDRLDRFHYLGVMESEKIGYARLFLILGGRIEPLVDLPFDACDTTLEELGDAIAMRVDESEVGLSSESVQNIGLVCRHLYRPAKSRTHCELLPLRDGMDRSGLGSALERLARLTRSVEKTRSPTETIIEDSVMEIQR